MSLNAYAVLAVMIVTVIVIISVRKSSSKNKQPPMIHKGYCVECHEEQPLEENGNLKPHLPPNTRLAHPCRGSGTAPRVRRPTAA